MATYYGIGTSRYQNQHWYYCDEWRCTLLTQMIWNPFSNSNYLIAFFDHSSKFSIFISFYISLCLKCFLKKSTENPQTYISPLLKFNLKCLITLTQGMPWIKEELLLPSILFLDPDYPAATVSLSFISE
jgi:hypothetical protein